jgi:hypothetical protein
MKHLQKTSLLLITIFVLHACSMQKRLYNKGFYTSKHQPVKKIASDKDTLPSVAINHVKVKSKNENLVVTNSKFITIPPVLVAGCDTIVLRSGARIVANVSEINQSQIKFKNCGSPYEAAIALKKADVSHILFANGTKETFTTSATSDEDKYIPQNISPDQNYGSSGSQYRGNKSYGDKKQNGFATAGFIVGLVSHPLTLITLFVELLLSVGSGTGFAFSWLYLPLVIALLGLIFSIVAIVQISQNKETQKGLVFAILGLVFSLILLAIFIAIYLTIV